MLAPEVQKPIINSPYEKPKAHWKIHANEPAEKMEGRRMATYMYLPSGGSIIFEEEAGQIPNLSGRLDPILDTHGRTYLYASNIAINEGQAQPVPFAYEAPIGLTDSNGKHMEVRVIMIVGNSVLMEYRPRQT